MPHFIGRLEKSIPIMYGREDLSAFPVFQGGFINFGYWDKTPKKPTKEQRALASHRLYEEILNRLGIAHTDTILEVGCGRGLGCRIALDQYKAKQVWGLDATKEQIDRCEKTNGLHFVQGFASQMPLPDQTFTKVFSVEAAQHFPSLPPFFEEVLRVLQPGGKFVFTTFFRQKGASLKTIGQWLQTVEKKIDFFHSIHTSLLQLQKVGFTNITHHNIGGHVWEGFHKWHTLVAPNDWGINWFKVYQMGLIDYYVLEAVKPSC